MSVCWCCSTKTYRKHNQGHKKAPNDSCYYDNTRWAALRGSGLGPRCSRLRLLRLMGLIYGRMCFRVVPTIGFRIRSCMYTDTCTLTKVPKEPYIHSSRLMINTLLRVTLIPFCPSVFPVAISLSIFFAIWSPVIQENSPNLIQPLYTH